jgi:hypothetical protein
MTDVLQKEIASPVPLTLENKEWKLSLPTSAVIRYKQKTGDNLFNVSHWARIDDDPEKLIALLWVAVQEHQPSTKLEIIEPLVNIGTSQAITKAVIELLRSYLPKPKPATGDADPNVSVPESK